MPIGAVIGRERIYNKEFASQGRADVVMWDILPIEDCQHIEVVFESANSPWRQGIWLRTDQGLVINNQQCPSAVVGRAKLRPSRCVSA